MIHAADLRTIANRRPLNGAKARAAGRRSGYWMLQDAKARFSELVRRARSEGPQHVAVRGCDRVVVIAAEEFRRLKGSVTGEALIAAMRTCPYRELDFLSELRRPKPET